MVTFVEGNIADDPTLRRLEIIEVVLTNCATRMWKMVPEKQLKAPTWVKKVRDAVRAQKAKLSVHKRDGSSTPAKAGSNGLYVASADTIVCKAPSMPDSRQDSLAAPPACLDSGRRDDAAVVIVPGESAPPKSSPFEAAASLTRCDKDDDGTEAIECGSPVTAATTPSGEVILVSSSGKQKSDASTTGEDGLLADVPLKIKRLSGGITNELFHVYDEACISKSVVVRIFGKETERVISRESELFYQSLFVETFVRGGNFLVYEYLDNYDTLPFQDMGMEMVKIADRVADFHVRSTLAARLDFNGPLVADASWREVPVEHQVKRLRDGDDKDNHHNNHHNHPAAGPAHTREAHSTHSRFQREANYTRQSLTTWAKLIQSDEIVEKVRVEKRGKFVELAAHMTALCPVLLSCLDQCDAELGEGSCHNDLLSANFMRHRTTGDIKIIDFDYTIRDYLLFDLANHFNEYTGLDCDYERYYPSQAHIRAFVVHYRQNMRTTLDAAHATLTAAQRSTLKEHIIPRERELFWTASQQQEDAVVTRWVQLVNLLAVCSNLGWAIWSLVQEAVSTLDVDFLEYAETRFNRALDTKDAALRALTASL